MSQIQDILSASTTLLESFSSALFGYASYEAKIRCDMKAIRTREEELNELRKKLQALENKTKAAEQKLSKMTQGDNRAEQMYLVAQLKDDGEYLRSQVQTEEAAMPSFKRKIVSEWMSLKFGGLAEFTGKGSVCFILRPSNARRFS